MQVFLFKKGKAELFPFLPRKPKDFGIPAIAHSRRPAYSKYNYLIVYHLFLAVYQNLALVNQ